MSCSFKRTFASCQKEEIIELKVRSQHVEELHPTLRPERREKKTIEILNRIGVLGIRILFSKLFSKNLWVLEKFLYLCNGDELNNT